MTREETRPPEKRSAARFMAVIVATVAAVGGAGLFLAQCTRTRPHTAGLTQREDGARLYRTYCGLCHGEDGEGYSADDANALNNQDFLISVTDTFLRDGIVYGHPGTAMAAYGESAGGPLSDGEVDTLVEFIRGWQEEPSVTLSDAPIEGDITRARDVFRRECATCHGERGQSASALSLNSGVYLRSASDAQIRYAIAQGRRGTPMPAFEGELRDQTLDDLVALIRSWAPDAPVAEADPQDDESPIGEGPAVLNPEGPAPEFPPLREGRYLPAEALAQAIESGKRVVILDARPPSDYVRFHVVGAIPSPYYSVEDVIDRIPNDGTWIISYCACPHAASGRVMDALRERGFQNTAVIDEGVLVWRDEGFPIVEGRSPGTLADSN